MYQAKPVADFLSGYGRYGDTMLMHVNPDEVRALNMMAGIAGRHLTTNPNTGLPEAFSLFDILPFAIDIIAPGMGTAAKVAIGAASGAASQAVQGGDPLTGALTGGVMSGVTSGLLGGGGGEAAKETLKASTEAANQAANQAASAAMAAPAATAAQQAGAAAANAGANIGNLAAERAVMDGIERTAAPTGYWKDILGAGSDEAAGKLFGLEGITALSTAASLFPQSGGDQEEEEYGPRGEWRPGQGYVPFQQAGVRSFSPAAVSPTGMEQSWITYGPSADPSTYRRFADGGPVYSSNPGNTIAQIRRSSGARSYTIPEGAPAPSRRGGRIPIRQSDRKAGKGGLPEQMPQSERMGPQVVSGADPNSYIQGGAPAGSAAFMPAMPAGVGSAMPPAMPPTMPVGASSMPSTMPMAGQGYARGGYVRRYADGGMVGVGVSGQPQAQQAGGKGGMQPAQPELQQASGKGGFTPQAPTRLDQPYGSTISPPKQAETPQINPGMQAGGPVTMPAGGKGGLPGYAQPYNSGISARAAQQLATPTQPPQRIPGADVVQDPRAIMAFRDMLGASKPQEVPQVMPTPQPAGGKGGVQPQAMPMPRGIPGPRARFRGQRFADGGPVMGGIAQGMEMPPMPQDAPMGVPMGAQAPQGGQEDQRLIQLAAAALAGQIPNGEQIIQMFVERYGEGALQKLMSMVNPQVPENMGRLLRGPGDGRSDSIPATIDGAAPAKLSTGEFVVPAKTVSKLGRGSTEAGAQKLQGMVKNVNRKPIDKAPAVIDDEGMMTI